MRKILYCALFIFCLNSIPAYAGLKSYYSDKYSSNTLSDKKSGYKKYYRNNLNRQCVSLCGNGYFYDRPGAKNNGKELVCTKYPLDCGYKCTIGWDFRYLVGGTNFTCQEAIQTR